MGPGGNRPDPRLACHAEDPSGAKAKSKGDSRSEDQFVNCFTNARIEDNDACSEC